MINLQKLQKTIMANKVKQGFNTTNIEKEFLLLYGEVAEAVEAYKSDTNTGEELADVAIYLFGLAEILNIDFEDEIVKKVKINQIGYSYRDKDQSTEAKDTTK